MAASDLIITLTRHQLYERIWETPMPALAKELDVNPGEIVALCKKHQIPRPTAGHWSKARHGKQTTRVPLPLSDQGGTSIRITPHAYYVALRKEDEEERERILAGRRRRITDEEHWQRLTDMADGWRQAQTIRSFLSALMQTVGNDKGLNDKAIRLREWAEDQLKELDPMSHDPRLVFEIMEEPVSMPILWNEI